MSKKKNALARLPEKDVFRLFCPFQVKWLEDKSDIALGEKSRRIGCLAMRAHLMSLTKKWAAGGLFACGAVRCGRKYPFSGSGMGG